MSTRIFDGRGVSAVIEKPRHRSDGGVATVWAAAWIFVCLMVGWLAMLAAAVVAAQHHLDAAADLSSLSAAARQQRGGDACRAAAQIAEANSVTLARCALEGADVAVTVTDAIRLPFSVDGRLTSTARAGPPV